MWFPEGDPAHRCPMPLVGRCGAARDPAASILTDRPRGAVLPNLSFSPSWTSAVRDALRPILATTINALLRASAISLSSAARLRILRGREALFRSSTVTARITVSLFFGRQVADPQLAELRLEQLIQQFVGRHRVRRHPL